MYVHEHTRTPRLPRPRTSAAPRSGLPRAPAAAAQASRFIKGGGSVETACGGLPSFIGRIITWY